MTPEVIAAVVALVGSAIGSFSGIIINNKLVKYRLKQLEDKVEKHNNLIERMAIVETTVDELKDKVNK